MARRGGRSRGRSRGRSKSRGRSSRGRSKSRSKSRSSSRKSSKRKSSTSSRRSTSRGRKTTSRTKGRATKRTTRTRTTRSAPARRARKVTSRATPRRVNRTVVRRTRTVSPPKPRLTGGRIAQKPQTVRNIQRQSMRGVAGRSIFAQQQQRNLTGTAVTVTFASGQKQTMRLSHDAIKAYQKQGLRVSPLQQTFGGFNPLQTVSNWFQPTQTALASPQIPRIQEQSPPWFANPPKQLHVNTPMKVKPNTRMNSNFGGLGANPWNPIESFSGLFNMSQQEQPTSQYLPQQQNTQSTGYPTYTAFAQGQNQEQAFEKTPLGFQTSMLGDSSFEPMDTIKNLASNQFVIIGGLAVGALIILKIVLGGRGGRGGGGGGTKIYT